MWKDREVILGELPPLSRQTSISIIDERWSDHFRIHQWRGRMNISQCIRTFLFDQYHTWYLSQAIHVPYRTFVCTNFEYTENYTKHQSYAICHTDPYFLSCPAFADGNMGRRTSQTMRRGAGAQSSICIREARGFQNGWIFRIFFLYIEAKFDHETIPNVKMSPEIQLLEYAIPPPPQTQKITSRHNHARSCLQ